ncbi:methyl-accepting chemotaxis protein [Salidesulfovibrio brasiliensis]
MFIHKLPFQTKLQLGILSVVAAAIVVMSVITFVKVQESLTVLGETSMEAFSESIYNTMQMQHDLLDDKVKGDLAIMEEAIDEAGTPYLDRNDRETVTIVNQVTGKKSEVTIPTMKFGLRRVNGNFDLVDAVQKRVGGTATIFQLLPGKLLRISTNVLKTDGKRAVGTFIPDSSPVYKTIMKGETYYGIAYVVNAWYQTAYKPLKNISGDTIGVIYVGRKILTPSFREAVAAATIGGEGYGFIFDQKGLLILHPSIPGKKLTEYPFWPQFRDATGGIVKYRYKGDDKQVFIKYFEPWGWSYGFSLTHDEMMHGVDKNVLYWNIGIAVASIVVLSLLMTLIIRIVIRPLRRLSAFTGEVSKGNYNATIEYPAKDAIGDTIDAVRDMTVELKNKLGFSEGLLNGLTIPCVVTDLNETITFVNQQELDLFEKSGKPEDYIGMPFGEFVYGDATKETILHKCMHEDTCILGQETTGETPSGRQYDIIVDSAPLRDFDGKIIGGFTLIKDMTAIKQGEREAKERHERLVAVANDADGIAEQLSSAAEQLSAQVEQSTRGTEVQRERVAETSTAMEEMNATVLEVARNASDAAENADNAREKAQEGATLVGQVVTSITQIEQRSEELKRSMTELGEQADGIGAIMQVIEDIADQTNLLALNAAIEAARAGEAGRGFAVVADEVRKLAEKTMDATKQVGKAVTDIQEGARRNVTATEEAVGAVVESTELANRSGTAMEEIQALVEQSADQVRNIATAAEEQSATSEEVNRATDEINVISTETSRAMEESREAIDALASLASRLKELIERMQ